jgi:hypothetical protein
VYVTLSAYTSVTFYTDAECLGENYTVCNIANETTTTYDLTQYGNFTAFNTSLNCGLVCAALDTAVLCAPRSSAQALPVLACRPAVTAISNGTHAPAQGLCHRQRFPYRQPGCLLPAHHMRPNRARCAPQR